MNAKELVQCIDYIFWAHSQKPTKPSKAVRKWDGRTSYGVHPTWCAMTLLTETSLPEDLRVRGAQALLLHDVLEDTTAGLPEGLDPEVATLVEGMTFASSEEEMELVWSRSGEVKLLKLYDKTSNMLDANWMSAEKRTRYGQYLLHLCDAVEPIYGPINIIRLAKAVI